MHLLRQCDDLGEVSPHLLYRSDEVIGVCCLYARILYQEDTRLPGGGHQKVLVLASLRQGLITQDPPKSLPCTLSFVQESLDSLFPG